MTEHEKAITEAVRRADAHSNAATRLLDDAEDFPQIELTYPGFWSDVRRFVIPTLEAEARKASEEVARLRGA